MKAIEIKHPLIQHKLTHMRKKQTNHKEFRESLTEITKLMAFEIFKNIKVREIEISTPISKKIKAIEISEEVTVVPIIRAGLGMLNGLIDILPMINVAHIGIYRDEKTKTATEYFFKYPNNISKSQVILIDPMLATGVSAIHAVDRLKEKGCTNIKFLSLLAAPEGIKNFEAKHPDVQIYTASIDSHLDKDKYIVPGLGDAGDRLYGTK